MMDNPIGQLFENGLLSEAMHEGICGIPYSQLSSFPAVFIAGLEDVAPQTQSRTHSRENHRDDVAILEVERLEQLQADALGLGLVVAQHHSLEINGIHNAIEYLL